MSAGITETDCSSPVIQKYTSSGLIKTIADNRKGFLLSGEIYDGLFKLLKSDDENTAGDVQVLCQLFSGEEAFYRDATEKTREISTNTPFSFAARLVTLMDQGHGLIERFLISFPKCLRPSPQEANQAVETLKESAVSSCKDILIEIVRLDTSQTSYILTQEANDTVNRLNVEFIAEVNEAITEGRTSPKTKKIDIILRVAASLYIFNHVASQLLAQTQPTPPTEVMERTTLFSAINYVTWAESQKEIFVEVSIVTM